MFWFCIADDPQFAPAWAWLGRTCLLLDKFNGEPSIPDIGEAAFQRAFVLDPDLACAHHFYTHQQVDLGRASEAMVRLAGRLTRRGEDPETLAGLVQTPPLPEYETHRSSTMKCKKRGGLRGMRARCSMRLSGQAFVR